MLGALVQSAHRDEGGEAWKGFHGFDFSERNPNHTGEAKPGTILKGKRKRRGREIPVEEAKITGHYRLLVNVLQPLYGRLGCCHS